MRLAPALFAACVTLSIAGCGKRDALDNLAGCAEEISTGARRFATSRDQRFEGKVQKSTALCRGGDLAVKGRDVPWVDWTNYYGTGDASSKGILSQPTRGIMGSLIDLEYERVELLKFNLFDNSGTFSEYLNGRFPTDGPAIKTWPEMRLPAGHPSFGSAGGSGDQLCKGELIRGRTLTGICNDIRNPLMGSTGMYFARNVEFENTFPELGLNEVIRNRHGGRLSLLTPDPQVISRKLFTRKQSDSVACADGNGKPGFATDASCDYKKAPFFNVLAAFWIQFMTHDWFSHLEEGRNAAEYMKVGCVSQKVNGVETPLTAEGAARLGCRPADAMERAFVADARKPGTFTQNGREYMTRAPKVFKNTNTAWWDASQLYGYDSVSLKRVKRDPNDAARLLMVRIAGDTTAGDRQGYLPTLLPTDPMNSAWAGQEATAFPDNWSIGASFYHNVFAREHNQFVDEFRRRAARTPDMDSGLRNPANPARVIRYRDVTPAELFEAAHLVVAAEIAKIHTIEWTTQLLYNEPLFRGMNGNWNGLLARESGLSRALAVVVSQANRSNRANAANTWYSIFATGPGIFGTGNNKRGWNLSNPDDVNGGVNHFGSPFNFPEEFITVYRLHPLVPDLIEFRDYGKPNAIASKIPVVSTFRGKATDFMRDRGLAGWALSMGRQRLGALALQNHPRFLQNLPMDRLTSSTKKLDVPALDLIRDRERGVTRFNEFRRQYGLRQLTAFDDFIDRRLPAGSAERTEQAKLVQALREVYGTHRCDSTKVITLSQRDTTGQPINDCLGHPNGSTVDNVEDLDTVVGFLAETTRPHGFAISETQFVVFILNASRRLYSDRFFTSSFRPEFYTQLGVDWVNNNGPGAMTEAQPINGHADQPVSPLKRVLLRTIPELKSELDQMQNAFDPWARDRGEYYSLQWKPRKGAESDDAFREPGK
ncbi:MAG: oxygenase [Gemmatimonadaceae bacterium]|nr:oxygenase [Gemmatimonadaceae bacterium]